MASNKDFRIVILVILVLVTVLFIGFYTSGQKPVCGNGIAEEGETIENCCVDVGCSKGQSCKDNKCFQLPIIDEKLINDLKERDSTYSLITLRDLIALNYSLIRTNEEKLEVYESRKTINKKIQDEIISNLTKDEFIVSSISLAGRWFDGAITTKGLEKLSKDHRVKTISRFSREGIFEKRPDLDLSFCEVEDDCIIVYSGCCNDLVSKKYENFVRESLEEECMHTVCVPEIWQNAYDNYIDCINNTCQIVECDNLQYSEGGKCNNYMCPELEAIDCMPSIPQEMIKYCVGTYFQWINENCDVNFTY